MTESAESREYVADWLRQVPQFMDELGIENRPDLASRLTFLGSGGRADVVFLGERDGIKQVLKITNDSAQAALSQAALEDEPVGVVPIYQVVETSITRRGLPELPQKGQQPQYEGRTWGIIEQLVVPVDALEQVGIEIDGEDPSTLVVRFSLALGAFQRGQRSTDPLVEDWRLNIEAAIEWVEDTCAAVGSWPNLDLHEGNFGVVPDTGELLLIDLGQCYTIPLSASAAE